VVTPSLYLPDIAHQTFLVHLLSGQFVDSLPLPENTVDGTGDWWRHCMQVMTDDRRVEVTTKRATTAYTYLLAA
jgi:hypothetical protein